MALVSHHSGCICEFFDVHGPYAVRCSKSEHYRLLTKVMLGAGICWFTSLSPIHQFIVFVVRFVIGAQRLVE